MRNVLLAAAMLALASSVAFAFPYTNWTGRETKSGKSRSVCVSKGRVANMGLPKNAGRFIGSMSTQADSFTLTVDGNEITLPMKPIARRGGGEPRAYRIEQPTPGQQAEFELTVQAILRQKLGDPGFVLTSAAIQQTAKGVNKGIHRLASRFQRVETKLQIEYVGSGSLGEYSGTVYLKFKGQRNSG